MAKGLVLVFHKEEDSNLFEQIVVALKKNYNLVTVSQLEQLLGEGADTSNLCHITFDDGVASFYTTVFPLLKKYEVAASLFVSPEVINSGNNFWFQEIEGYGELVLKNILSEELNISPRKLAGLSNQMLFKCLPIRQIKKVIETYQQKTKCGKKAPENMNAEQLKEVDASGLVTIGAHTISHPILANEDDESCFHEISWSITSLSNLLGHPVAYFAYPNGRPGIDFGDREFNYLRKCGITTAFSTELNTLSDRTELLAIPRMGFARMGLAPSNPLIKYRLSLGKKWIDIRSIGKPTEKEVRKKIREVLSGSSVFKPS